LGLITINHKNSFRRSGKKSTACHGQASYISAIWADQAVGPDQSDLFGPVESMLAPTHALTLLLKSTLIVDTSLVQLVLKMTRSTDVYRLSFLWCAAIVHIAGRSVFKVF
jgi:hypothetical protein